MRHPCELGESLAGKNIFTTFAGDKVYEKTHTYRYADANDGCAIGASIRTGSDGTSYAPARRRSLLSGKLCYLSV